MNRPRKKDKHLPACVYFKHGTHWYVKRGTWTNIGKTISAALAEYARIVETPKGGMADLIDRVMDVHLKTVSENTKLQYVIAARALKNTFREFAPDQVRGKHVAAMKLAGADTPNMTNRKLSLLRTVFNYAVEWQEVESNPCVGIKRLTERQRDRYLTDAEVVAIRAKAGPRLQVIIDLLFLTGQRIEDVLKIRRADITDAGILFKQKKTDTKLTVKWTPDLKEAVERAKALHPKVTGLYLLPARKGKAPDYKTVWDQWHEAREAAGVEDATPHDMRAKSATDADEAGANAQALMGHSNPNMTKRYIRRRKGAVAEGPRTTVRERKG